MASKMLLNMPVKGLSKAFQWSFKGLLKALKKPLNGVLKVFYIASNMPFKRL
jgi:hypothetical protein